MSRLRLRRSLATADNHDRWLVSYADFITLLFAFFVVLFAVTKSDKTRVKALSEAVRRALAHEHAAPPTAAIQPLPPNPAAELLPYMGVLKAALKDEIQNGAIRLSLESRGLVISLNTAAFFASGEDTIYSAAYSTIEKVAAILQKLPNPLRLEGHTDSLPIKTPRFQSNWELSAARSIAMLKLLNEKFGVARERMAIVGYADTESVDSNETEEGRSKNRRVNIVIVSEHH